MQEARKRIKVWKEGPLDLSYLGLTELPMLPASLKWLYCYNNQLPTLPTLPASLKRLHCYDNQLQTLPTLPASLKRLYCYDNQLPTLPALPASLKSLYCGNNQLQTLPTLPASLEWLYCWKNQLQTLPTLPASLNTLDCRNNPALPFTDIQTWRRLDRLRAAMRLRPLQHHWRHVLIRRRTRPKDQINFAIRARPGHGVDWFAFLEAIQE